MTPSRLTTMQMHDKHPGLFSVSKPALRTFSEQYEFASAVAARRKASAALPPSLQLIQAGKASAI